MTPRWRTRIFVLVTSATLYALALLFVLFRLAVPSDGTRLGLRAANIDAGTVVIHAESPQRNGFIGDEKVIEVNGKPVAEWVNGLFSAHLTASNWAFGDTVIYTVQRDSGPVDIPIQLNHFRFDNVWQADWPFIIFTLVLQIEAIWLFAAKPDERLAQLLFLAGCATATFSVCFSLGMNLSALISARWLWLYYRAVTTGMMALICSLIVHFSIILPRHRTDSLLRARLIVVIYALPYALWSVFVIVTYQASVLSWLRQWDLGNLVFIAVCFVTAVMAVSAGYLRLKDRLARRRVGIVAIAFCLTTLLMLTLGWVPMWSMQQDQYGWGIMPLFALPLALGLALAVVFYQLLDIRVVIQRTVIWGGLTLAIIAIYSVVVGALGILFQSQDNPYFSLAATGLAAVLAHPLRIWLQRGVTVRLFGERDRPYKVISHLTAKLDAALAPQDALYTIVQTVSQSLKLPYTAIELLQEGEFVVAMDYGNPEVAPCDEQIKFPLKYGSELVGHLVVAPRAPGDSLSDGDRRLLAGLAHSAEVTIRTARLTADLQRSREKLAATREEERRHLRRELHDGLGPALAGLTMQVDAARNLLNRDPAQADDLLKDLKTQVQTAFSEVRRLAYELRPPALDELGLVGALSEKARQLGQTTQLTISIDSPTLPALPAAIESAAYRIVLEALSNASHHAAATRCFVRLSVNGRLRIEIRDNGKGFSSVYQRGVGINSMIERADELGGTCLIQNDPQGGAVVCVTLPLTADLLPTNKRDH